MTPPQESAQGPGGRREAVLLDFLQELLEDIEQGSPLPLAEYLTRFPGFEQDVAREYLAQVDRHRQAQTLSARLRERYGRDVDPSITLSSGDAQEESADDPSRAVLERLSGRGRRRGRYRVGEEVARGGSGAILRVWDEDLRRQLAMKVVLGRMTRSPEAAEEIDPRTLGRFIEEAQVTGQLDHPGIVPVHELGLDEQGRLYFTMRLVKGRTLKEVFDLAAEGHEGEREGWSRTRVLGELLKVCEAMAYAHSKGVLHRDIKPSNVMVGRFGEAYVMDWGLARVLGREDSRDLRLAPAPAPAQPTVSIIESERGALTSSTGEELLYTMDGDVVGTPAYMSPEQAHGRVAELDARSDVYAVGAMLYQLLSGRTPFVKPGSHVSSRTILARVLEGPPTPLAEIDPELPGELVAICEKAMARDPRRRYADMQALAGDLRAYLEGRVVRAFESGHAAELRSWVRRNRGLAVSTAAAVVIAFVGLGGVGYVQAEGRKEAEDQRLVALESEADARRERANVLRLSASQSLADLRAEAQDLWPAQPDRIPRLEAWLERARELVAGLDGEQGLRAQLDRLTARGTPLAPEVLDARRRSDPRFERLQQLRAELDARLRAQEVREGRREAPLAELPANYQPGTVDETTSLVLALTEPERLRFGDEPRGLALAREQVERMERFPARRHTAENALVWALVANGLDQEALPWAEQAAVHAPPRLSEEYYRRLAELRARLTPEGRERVRRELDALAERAATLAAEIEAGLGLAFEHEEDRWWHAQLSTLVAELTAFADPEQGLLAGRACPGCWSVTQRLEFARELEARAPERAPQWDRARAAIADPRECPAYEGFDLPRLPGLLPLGPDPHSGLWEFAHLATGTAPGRNAAGELEFDEGSGLVLVLIPGGTARVGSQASSMAEPNYDPASTPQERPVHEVELEPYLLSKYELTQGQWERLTRDNPSSYRYGNEYSRIFIDARHPVETLTWIEAREVLGRVGLALPSEAQWEHAARAGSDSAWWTGSDLADLAGSGNLTDILTGADAGPFRSARFDAYPTTAPVGSFRPNDFGLHDVVGNVYEWCEDPYEPYALAAEKPAGAPATDLARVLRGGSCHKSPDEARSAARLPSTPGNSANHIGVRPVLHLPPRD